jgi:D-proline reductase (dithiol) PrdB
MDDPLEGQGEPVDYIERTRALYEGLGFPPYRWVCNEGAPPWTPVRVPLEQATVVLIASGGIYERGQRAFHFADDDSFRVIDAQTPLAELRATHFAYDLTDARSDPNVVFPLGTLRALVADGTIGAVARECFTFMGGIYSARKVREQLAPALVDRVRALNADLALLVPV